MEKELQKLEPSDGDVILIKVDENTTEVDMQETIEAFNNALKSIEANPAYIIMPKNMEVSDLPERKLNNIGFYRRVDVEVNDKGE